MGGKKAKNFLVQNTALLASFAAQVSFFVALLLVPLASQARCDAFHMVVRWPAAAPWSAGWWGAGSQFV